ncbi:MAG: aldehyde dehydrogenase family protein [Bosea sp.]|uniref:aldehyde dehydrogenase family protein n=1 Tax=Bosea sp. (in: a-proteobacteria) TaxID=1871050 RepID=UPI001AD34775|nr:aldehyde dehydrogenase family protein [Bosea sp. (in: a-proteobacteria)]MBN9453327.1 aldehyde dehydrogenase family protein [Bosea sp. (in: a-proteobacteria)]
MNQALPRVTYSNIGTDFSGVFGLLQKQLEQDAAAPARAFPNLIGGKPDEAGARYIARSPIDGSEIGSFFEAGQGEVDRAISAASAAFREWGSRPWKERVALVRRVADRLSDHKYEVAAACIREVGKSFGEAMGEVEEAIDLVRYYSDQLEANDGFYRPLSRAVPIEETSDVLRPYGVFAVIVPFNFPVALGIGMLAGALLGGNAVVLKPSPQAGLTGHWLARLCEEAGIPGGVVNLLCGGAEVGQALVDHSGVAGYAFIGSHAVGTRILRSVAAGGYNRPVIIEMGGKNPCYVTASADLDVAAEGVMRSAFGLQGQKCSSCSKVYVDRRVYAEFMDKLVAKSRAIKIGAPRSAATFMGPLINEAAFQRFAQACDQARRDGRIVHGGERLEGGEYDGGFYVAPTIVEGLAAEHRLNKDELFLPFLSVQVFDDLEMAIRDGNDIAYGLTAGAYARDEAELNLFLDKAEAGALYANRASGATTGAWPGVQTFCGWKGSGVAGKGALGPYYVQQFMREQSRTIMRTSAAAE